MKGQKREWPGAKDGPHCATLSDLARVLGLSYPGALKLAQRGEIKAVAFTRRGAPLFDLLAVEALRDFRVVQDRAARHRGGLRRGEVAALRAALSKAVPA